MFRLDGKVAIVTGAGSGIGRDIALLYARQGARVVVADINPDAAQAVAGEIEASGGVAWAQVMDVSQEASVQQSIETTVQREGRLDIIVNNAGVSHVGNVLETSVADWERVMGVNARGVFLCCKHAIARMLAQEPKGGVIVNLASVAGMVGIGRRLPYSASKGAVMAITRSVAMDFVDQNIRVNAICPGTILTPFVEGYLERDFPERKEEVRAELHARQPLGRMGRPDEIASAALYLASDEAAFVTGSMFVIDGGLTAR